MKQTIIKKGCFLSRVIKNSTSLLLIKNQLKKIVTLIVKPNTNKNNQQNKTVSLSI